MLQPLCSILTRIPNPSQIPSEALVGESSSCEAQIAFARAQAVTARSPLGRKLWEIRARIIASGVPLLSDEEIEQAEQWRG